MDQAPYGSLRGNMTRPGSKLPLARATKTPTSIHQDEPSKQSHLPRSAALQSKISGIKPLGESNSVTVKSSFGWTGRLATAPMSPTRSNSTNQDEGNLDDTPPNSRLVPDLIKDGDENIANDRIQKICEPTKRKPRLSLAERTIETLSQISPAPSPTRRRSSTTRSGGSMGPPVRPASSMRTSRPTTPSTPSSGRAPSPVKRHCRPLGRSVSPMKLPAAAPSALENIYTPPRAFVRDSGSGIGRPPRENRRSISTALAAAKEPKIESKLPNQAVKVKSMYDLRSAAGRTPNGKPSLPILAKNPSTPKTLSRKPSFRETSPQTSLLKARAPGENVLASASRTDQPPSKVAASSKKHSKRTPIPKGSQKQDSAKSDPAKSSTTLREAIAKAKATKRQELKSELETGPLGQLSAEYNVFESIPFVGIDNQSLKKKIMSAVTSGQLNLSAMALKQIPNDVFTMYDNREENAISWFEAVDLKKLILADNEIESLPESAFPDWSQEEMLADTGKSNQFGGLEVLDLHGNLLNTLPVGIRQLQGLSILNLSRNHLDLTAFQTFGALHNLRELRLAKNGLIGSVPIQLTDMHSLQILDLTDNQFDSLPGMSSLHSLQRVLLGGNNMKSVPLDALPVANLLELDVSRNSLSGDFDADQLMNFEKIQSLDLSYNNISSICGTSISLPSLRTLAVHNNRIAEIPDMSGCVELLTATAAENILTRIPEGFYALRKLKNADFSCNNIKTIGPELMSMESLSVFNVAGNPLREKKYLTLDVVDIKADLARKNSPTEGSGTAAKQTELDLTNNETTSGPTGTTLKPKGGVLDASSRSLSTLDPSEVDLSSPIHTIRLANNELTTFPTELLMHPSVRWHLRSLDMSHNPNLHSIDYMVSDLHLPLLQSLYIVSTGMTTLETLTTYLKAPELKELNISCHRLTGHVPWVRAWYPSLTTLLASDNWFESIDVEAVRGLEILDIRNNEIEILPSRIGLLGNHANKNEEGKLRSFECVGNRYRVPRLAVIERGTEAVLRDLRRMIPAADVPEEWMNEV